MLLFLALAVLVVDVGRDLVSATYSIDDAPQRDGRPSVPDFAPLLRDEIGRLTRAGYVLSTPQPEAVEADQPKIKVAGAEFSLGFATTLLRRALFREIKHISGELSTSIGAVPCSPQTRLPTDPSSGEDGTFRLVLRASDGRFGPFFRSTGCLDDVLRDGAIATLEQIDPVTAAGALSTRPSEQDHKAALRLIEATIAAQRQADSKGLAAYLPPFRVGLHRALLMKGLVEQRMGSVEAAAQEFRLADTAYGQGSLHGGRHWSVAQDSLGYALVELADADFDAHRDPGAHLAAAAAAIGQSLADDAEYDSARYHLAMIDDHAARMAFRAATDDPPTIEDLCPAAAAADRARAGYRDLLAIHPTFTIAHHDWGVLDLQELLFVQTRDRPACDAGQAPRAEARVAVLEAEAGEHLQAAEDADPSLPFTHAQLAHLDMQLQEPGFVHAGDLVPDRERRLKLLAAARSEVEQAIRWGMTNDDTDRLSRDIDLKERELAMMAAKSTGASRPRLGGVP